MIANRDAGGIASMISDMIPPEYQAPGEYGEAMPSVRLPKVERPSWDRSTFVMATSLSLAEGRGKSPHINSL
ncbi:hypothetical protein GCM10020258_05510 [Sphingomonas yabuuchiae]